MNPDFVKIERSFPLTVVIRTKNSEKTIQLCISYLLKQTINVQEIIIVDSGSTDSTLQIVKSFNCVILEYPSNEEFNYSKALNIGISESKGSYILNLSSHVFLINPRTIEYMVIFLLSNKSICAVSTYRKDKEDTLECLWNKVEWKVFTRHSFEGTAMFNPCALFEKKYWEEYKFKEILPTAEDQDWIYYFMKNYNLAAVVMYNPYVLYKNPYFNTKKVSKEKFIIGKYIYPPHLQFKYLFYTLTWASLGSLLKGNFRHVLINYRYVLLVIKDKLGFDNDIRSSYNKKLN